MSDVRWGNITRRLVLNECVLLVLALQYTTSIHNRLAERKSATEGQSFL